jgi:hypothetical protein
VIGIMEPLPDPKAEDEFLPPPKGPCLPFVEFLFDRDVLRLPICLYGRQSVACLDRWERRGARGQTHVQYDLLRFFRHDNTRYDGECTALPELETSLNQNKHRKRKKRFECQRG